MAIAGIEPSSIDLLSDVNLYTETQVRNILIKFCKECEINGRAYEMGETREDFVDEFMKMGD